jgi:hypothetical protein
MTKFALPAGKNRVLTGAAGHAATLGRTTDVFVALLAPGVRTKPTQQTLTIGTAGGATTTLTVTQTISANIQAGQYLMFTNTSTGQEYLVRVAANVNSGSSITIATAVAGGIPDGAIATFPAYLWDRSAADVDRSYNRSTFATFNTGGDEDGVITGASRTFTCPGIFYGKNDGYFTALFAAENGREVWVQRVTGDSIIEGPAVVTAAPTASPVDGNVSADLTFAFQGKPDEVFSVAG